MQSSKPKIHLLYEKSDELIIAHMNVVIKQDNIPSTGPELSFQDDTIILKPSECDFEDGVRRAILSLSSEGRHDSEMNSSPQRTSICSQTFQPRVPSSDSLPYSVWTK